jgi:hypothetical protein
MIGWVLFSRKDVAAAEQALSADEQGVRDEIGFLALHQALADRFFPGTSVLHTRLRYALFVPWLMLHAEGNTKNLRKSSLRLTQQLAAANEGGVIGQRILPREPAQTPAMIYWSALGRWDILQPRMDGIVPTRDQVMKRIALAAKSSASNRLEIDGERIADWETSPFVSSLPKPPNKFLQDATDMNFTLLKREQDFLRDKLMAVKREDGKQSLLGVLAEKQINVIGADIAWHTTIQQAAADEDKAYLKLAQQASSLAGIGRAVYAALVEKAKNQDDGARNHEYWEHLCAMCEEHDQAALALDLQKLQAALPTLPSSLLKVLDDTKKWFGGQRKNLNGLEEIYRSTEVQRKGRKARLGPSEGAKRRRAEWNTPQMPYPKAEPLHYRWFRVRQLLNDLNGH